MSCRSFIIQNWHFIFSPSETNNSSNMTTAERYLVFGVAAMVTLVLDVCSSQNLQGGVGFR